MDSIDQALRAKGRIPGKDVDLEYRAAEGASDRLPDLAREITQSYVKIILTTTVSGLQAARQATTSIPIVIAGVDDAVQQGFVGSLSKPGGNITGISWLNTELSAKRLQLLSEVVPGESHVAFLREGVGGITQLQAMQTAAHNLGITLEVIEVLDRSWLPNTFLQIRKGGAKAVVVADSPMFSAEGAYIADLAIRNSLPTMFPNSRFVHSGGLMSYGPKLPDVYGHAVDYVDRILRGTPAGDLPVEQPTNLEWVVNIKTAKAIGLPLSLAIYTLADEVLE